MWTVAVAYYQSQPVKGLAGNGIEKTTGPPWFSYFTTQQLVRGCCHQVDNLVLHKVSLSAPCLVTHSKFELIIECEGYEP